MHEFLELHKANMQLNSLWKPLVTMLLVNFALAVVNLLYKKVLDGGMHPWVIVTWRQAIAALFLSPVAYLWERQSRGRPNLTTQILCHLFLSALVGATLTQYFFLLGLRYTSATFACAFINMVPVNTFILALPFGLEKVNIKSNRGKGKAVGTLVCVGGAMLLTLYKGMPLTNPTNSQSNKNHHNHMTISSSKRTERWAIGSIVLAAGSLLWSSWFLIQSRIGQKYPFRYSVIAIMSFFSAVQCAALGFISDRSISTWVPKAKLQIFTVIYAGVVASALCYVGMSWCLKQRGPVFTAAFSPLIQIFVVIFDFSLLREQIHLGSVLGSVLVIVGLFLVLWGKSKEAGDYVVEQDWVAKEDGDNNLPS